MRNKNMKLFSCSTNSLIERFSIYNFLVFSWQKKQLDGDNDAYDYKQKNLVNDNIPDALVR